MKNHDGILIPETQEVKYNGSKLPRKALEETVTGPKTAFNKKIEEEFP